MQNRCESGFNMFFFKAKHEKSKDLGQNRSSLKRKTLIKDKLLYLLIIYVMEKINSFGFL